jgi:hypothetical protein
VYGQKVTITGKVTPASPGENVRLERAARKRGPWKLVRTKKVAADGTYTVKDQPAAVKTHWYRIVKPASKTRSAGVSAPMRVLVYKWSYLTEVSDAVDYDDFYANDTYINGTYYRYSVFNNAGRGDGFIEYNLRRRCRALDTVLGLNDNTETGGTKNLKVLADGAVLYDKTLGLGQSDRLRFNVQNILRIRLEATVTDPDKYAYPGAGNPRILCR